MPTKAHEGARNASVANMFEDTIQTYPIAEIGNNAVALNHETIFGAVNDDTPKNAYTKKRQM
jgi:hypothetical protein